MNPFGPLRDKVAKTFESAFGSTPLNERVIDILAQATSIGRFRDMAHLKQEAGDILSSVLQLCTECDWEPDELVSATLRKIESRTEIYRKLGRKLRVGILGGAFDPIHVSHIKLARDVLDSGAVDEVWLMPCFDHLGGKSMAPASLRLEMCQAACEKIRGVRVFDYEIRHEFRGESYHLVKKLLSDESAQTRFDYFLIIGQDNADTMLSWTNSEGLERLIPFIVVPRKGCEPSKPSSWYLHAPHRVVQPASHSRETSSTEVRSLLARGDGRVLELLPDGVWDIIRHRRLYSPEPATPISNRKIALYASTFDPPTLFHREQVEALLKNGFDEVVIFPTGPRPQTGDYEHASPLHRAAIASLAFRGLDRVNIDYSDLSLARFSPPCELEDRLKNMGEVWHVVHHSMLKGGARNASTIQLHWDNGAVLWQNSRFVVLQNTNELVEQEDLPSRHQLVIVPERPASAELRARVYRGESIDDAVDSEVASYIKRHRLFLPSTRSRHVSFRVDRPRLLIVADERNQASVAIAKKYSSFAANSPNLILVLGGDGTMLRAIRENWRLRVPFVGLNTGHLGFLMNERLPDNLQGLELLSYSQPMLRVDAKSSNGEQTMGLAYSDVWLERAEGQAAWLRIDVDGETRVSKVVGDGMLIATASGSSAYARAMGAVPVPIDSQTLTLAGSNVFQPNFWKPMILSDDSQITMSSLDLSGKRPLRAFIDGSPLGIVQEISVRRSLTASVELAFTKEFDPSAKLLRTLFPPDLQI